MLMIAATKPVQAYIEDVSQLHRPFQGHRIAPGLVLSNRGVAHSDKRRKFFLLKPHGQSCFLQALTEIFFEIHLKSPCTCEIRMV